MLTFCFLIAIKSNFWSIKTREINEQKLYNLNFYSSQTNCFTCLTMLLLHLGLWHIVIDLVLFSFCMHFRFYIILWNNLIPNLLVLFLYIFHVLTIVEHSLLFYCWLSLLDTNYGVPKLKRFQVIERTRILCYRSLWPWPSDPGSSMGHGHLWNQGLPTWNKFEVNVWTPHGRCATQHYTTNGPFGCKIVLVIFS